MQSAPLPSSRAGSRRNRLVARRWQAPHRSPDMELHDMKRLTLTAPLALGPASKTIEPRQASCEKLDDTACCGGVCP